MSAAHGQGIRSLLEAALEGFEFDEDAEAAEDADAPMQEALADRDADVADRSLAPRVLGREGGHATRHTRVWPRAAPPRSRSCALSHTRNVLSAWACHAPVRAPHRSGAW